MNNHKYIHVHKKKKSVRLRILFLAAVRVVVVYGTMGPQNPPYLLRPVSHNFIRAWPPRSG